MLMTCKMHYIYTHVQGAISCPEYSAVNYTFVLLEDSTGLEETSDGALMVAEKLLEENSRYFFNVKAANKVGAVKSAPILIGRYR